jgi:hypothetical protein
MMWTAWFAWYPVRADGYSGGVRWHGKRWVWLRQVEWIEGHMIGEWLYRIPEPEH